MSGLLPLLTCLWLASPPVTARPPSPAEQPITLAPFAEPAPRFAFETFEGDPIAVQQFVLPNGLTVLLSENHERPEVFGAVVVRTGGKNDPADNTGLAHYLEHMLFKGTRELGTTDWAAEEPLQAQLAQLYERHKQAEDPRERAAIQAEIAEVVAQTYAYVVPNELDRMLEELGGAGVNAFTSEDETVYHNVFPASQIDAWLAIYAHRFVDPVFRLFPTELEAVYEEKNISLDRFEIDLYEHFLAAAFPEHPYGTQSVLGEIEHLQNPSLVAVQRYFDEFYVANNMALVLAGDFDADALMPIIAERFGAWRSGPEPEARGGEVEPFAGRELLKVRLTPIRVGAFGFRTPTASDPDYAALTVIRELLSNEQGSGSIDQLVADGKLLIALPFPLGFADHGFEIVFFAPRIFSQTFKSAEALLLDRFQGIGRGEFDEQQMLAIRDGLLRAEDLQWETNEDRALAIADNFIRRDDWQAYLDYRERLAGLTREEVMRVAARYFGDDYLAMRSRLGPHKTPKLSKPHYPTVTPQPGAHSSFYAEVMRRPSPAPKLDFVDLARDVTTTPLAEHVTLRTNPNPFNGTYSLALVFGVGSDRIRELGVAGEYIERIGTRTDSPTALRERLTAIGTTLSIVVSDDRTYVRMTGPDPQLGPALALLDDVLREPVADRQRWKSFKRERNAGQRIERKDPDYLASAAREYLMYGERSQHLRDYGRRGLRGLEPEQLLGAWEQAQGYALEVRYVGQRPSAEVAELLSSQLDLARTRTPAVDHVVRERVLPNRDTVYFLPRRKLVQTQLAFLVDGDPVPADQYAVADAYNEYMGGGMAGVVFQEIREFRALAYSAWAGYFRDQSPAQAGYFVGEIGCQADKTFDAIDVMLGLIRERPAEPERMSSIRAALARGLETRSPGFRELQGRIASWQRSGYTDDPRRALVDGYAALDFADVEAFHTAQIEGRPLILLVVADPSRVDARALARYGEVVELSERDVFAP